MRKKNPRPNIVSMRITDDEFEDLKELMKLRKKKASEILREGFVLLRTDWEMVLRARQETARFLGTKQGMEVRSAGSTC